MIVATFLTLAWTAAIEYLWSNLGLSSAVLLEGTQANRVSSKLARVDEAVVPVIWYSMSALLLPLFLWFLKCWSMKIGTGEARLLRGTWISLFLLSLVMCAAITYFQGFQVGRHIVFRILVVFLDFFLDSSFQVIIS